MGWAPVWIALSSVALFIVYVTLLGVILFILTKRHKAAIATLALGMVMSIAAYALVWLRW
jgi:hypothetical protein